MQRTLVIDDDVSVTRALKRGLSYAGFMVDTASSGAEGLALAREHYPDVVILDVMMPVMHGLEVLRRLRAADPRLPVMLLTTKDAPTDQVAGLEQDADDYVVKPFALEVLIARTRALLRRQEQDQPAVLRELPCPLSRENSAAPLQGQMAGASVVGPVSQPQ